MHAPPDDTMNGDLLELIKRFNRKERFILFEQAMAGTGGVELSQAYRAELVQALPDVIVPPEVPLVLTDYHLNWLYAALELHAGTWTGRNRPPGKPAPRDRQALERNQEDIDLLLGWKAGDDYHLVLIEAKAHTGWSSSQMTSKADRLTHIFGEHGSEHYRDVRPHLVLTSFKKPVNLMGTKNWPAWMRTVDSDEDFAFLPLDPGAPRLKVGEVDEDGRPKAGTGLYAVTETKV